MTEIPRAYEPNLIDQPAVAQALRVMLMAMFLGALAISALALTLRWRQAPRVALIAAAASLVALLSSRSGWRRHTMLFALLSMTYAVIHLAARSEGVNNIGLAILPVLIVVCSLLLDRLKIIITTTTIILAVVAMLFVRYFVLQLERYSTNDIGDLFVFIVTCATAALVGRLLAVRIEEGTRMLRESEARLRIALDATGAGAFEFHPESGTLIWSDISRRHFGMSPETEVDHDILLRAVHPDDRERIRQAGPSLGLLGSDGQLATEYRTIGVEDGKERWIAVRGRMLFDRENRPIRLIGTTLDISERKRMEEELRRRAEELQKIMDMAPVALFAAHDPECREVTVNRMGNAMIGAAPGANSPAAPGGRTPPCPFFRDGIRVPVDELPLQTAARGIEVRDVELEAVLPSGKRRLLWGHASPLHDAAGRVRGAVAAFQDVTDARQRVDDLLRESEERFRDTADAAPIIIWFGDTEKRLTFVNKAMTLFTGMPTEKILDHGWEQVLHPDDLATARAVYYEAVDRRTSYEIEYRARRADGEYRHMLGTTSPRYVGNSYAGHVGSVIDITDLKRRQEQDAARQKWESLGTLAAGIAHDFNNLMGGILAQAELAQAELADGTSADAKINAILAVALRGAEIVRQLMTYAGQEEATLEPVNVSRLVEESKELLNVAVSKHATLQLRLTAAVPAVRANAATLRQILINLVSNASDAIGERDGVIQVSTSRVNVEENQAIAGNRLPAGNYVQLEVSDTGCGIPPEIQSKVFDPFFRRNLRAADWASRSCKESSSGSEAQSASGATSARALSFRSCCLGSESPPPTPAGSARMPERNVLPREEQSSWSKTRNNCGSRFPKCSAKEVSRSWRPAADPRP